MKSTFTKSQTGFTMLEIVIVAAIIGILAAIAVPQFQSYQLRTKSAEAKVNLAAIRVSEEAAFSEAGLYTRADAEPAWIPGTTPDPFDVVGSDFAALGWKPEGPVYFSYAVEVSADGTGYTADAAADIDGDGVLQNWGYVKLDGSGNAVGGGLGCDPAVLGTGVLGSCVAGATTY